VRMDKNSSRASDGRAALWQGEQGTDGGDGAYREESGRLRRTGRGATTIGASLFMTVMGREVVVGPILPHGHTHQFQPACHPLRRPVH
jgi:hypothetical protein